MARKKREFTTFSLSFLDIMSCGLGAVALVFLIIKHDVNEQIDQQNIDLTSEVSLLEIEVKEGEEHLVAVKNTLSAVDMELVRAEGLARRINQDIMAIRDKIHQIDTDDTDQQIVSLEKELRVLTEQKKALEEEQTKGNELRRIQGQGQRQYLTGLHLGGERIVLLLDVSASMLAEKLVNVIRRKNMSDEVKRQSPKWQRALSAVEWLVAQFPINSNYQIYTFNTKVTAAVNNTQGTWLSVENNQDMEQAMINLRAVVPDKGTSLERAFLSLSQLDPLPDNVILLTDGLPTQGLSAPKRYTITGADREELFENALEVLPTGIPVNILLWPMEGDPMAASSFWKLATYTAGSFLSPSKDWP
ncbi:MAG: hypothetical protein ACI8WB_000290 [Phenylobacterium sp.]|jgi:hypothetical protein